jgi:ComF family protein
MPDANGKTHHMIAPANPTPPASAEDGRRGVVRLLLRSAWDFVFPRVCEYCQRPVAESAESDAFGPALCSNCRNSLAPEIAQCCNRCAAPIGPFLPTDRGCVYCRESSFAFERAVALGVYDGELRAACLQMKKDKGAPLAASLGSLLWERRRESLQRAEADVVLPVPHHWSQRFTRSHNASVTLARVLARRLQLEFCCHILKKVRRTAPQASLPPTKRRANLRGAFRVPRYAGVSGQSVLLVDDILTTGTTAHVATQALRKAGARRVVVAVVARGLGKAPASRLAGR